MKRSWIWSLTLATASLLHTTAHGQVHHWTFDETSGLTASDLECRQGRLVGFDAGDDSHWVDGTVNGGLDLGSDGIFDNRVEAMLEAIGTTGEGFTVSMWINPGETILSPGEYQLLSTPGDAVGFTLMNFDDGNVFHDRVLLFWDGDLANLHVGTTTLEPGEWYHIAITSGGIGGEKRYYIDGEPEAQTLFLPDRGGEEGSHPSFRDGWEAGLGRIGTINGAARAHDSIVDDVRIYDRELTPEEIADVFVDEPSLRPAIANVSPESGQVEHDPSDGLAFDAVAQEPGVTIPTDGIRLLLNGEDVSADLSIGGTERAREVIYDRLAGDQAYEARIEIIDSAGQQVCSSISFATFEEREEGLVHHFTFDETSGLLALDTGSARNGTLVNFELDDDSQWARGACENGLDFSVDGSLNNYVEFTANAVNAFDNGGFTVSMWINPGEQINNQGEYQLLSTPGDAIGFTIMNSPPNGADRVLLFWDGSLPDLHVGTTTLEPGTWYHVAITSTGIGGEKLYYVNGELEEQTLFIPDQGGAEGVHPGTRDGWGEGIARIGAINVGARGHDSLLDEVRIYNRALDADEMIELFESCVPVICQPLSLADLSPTDGDSFHDAAQGIVFEVSTTNAGFTISPESIELFLNDVDVSGDLTIGGNETTRTVSYDGLEANTAYQARLRITDGCDTVQRIFSFATFVGCPSDDDSLIHHFKLDETSGQTTFDCVGGAVGTLVNFGDDDAHWIEGQVDGALDFGADGSINNAVDFEIQAVSAVETGGFTIAMWINPGERINSLGEHQLLSTPGDQVGFTIMNSDGEVRHDRVLLFWDGSAPDLHVGTTTLEPGTWYHVAITSTGVGGEKKFFVNGQLDEPTLYIPSLGGEEGNHVGTRDGWPAGPARLGSFGGFAPRQHDTAYDDVRIYNRALEEEEIEELYGDDPPPPEKVFHRGDADDNGEVQLTDAIRILSFLFQGGAAPTCEDAADADNNSEIQLTDAIRILAFLFQGGPPPSPPGPDTQPCGPDPDGDEDGLGCASYESCES